LHCPVSFTAVLSLVITGICFLDSVLKIVFCNGVELAANEDGPLSKYGDELERGHLVSIEHCNYANYILVDDGLDPLLGKLGLADYLLELRNIVFHPVISILYRILSNLLQGFIAHECSRYYILIISLRNDEYYYHTRMTTIITLIKMIVVSNM
jgi:hypothetical protein